MSLIQNAVEQANNRGLGIFMHQDPFSNERCTSKKRRTSRNQRRTSRQRCTSRNQRRTSRKRCTSRNQQRTGRQRCTSRNQRRTSRQRCTSRNQRRNAEQIAEIDQSSNELIVIRDSCDIKVVTTDTQVAVSLQAALQVAIAIVVNITIADSNRAEIVTQELLEKAQIRQSNRQKLIIVNSRSVEVTTTDTDVAISLQLLLQILVALVAQLDIL